LCDENTIAVVNDNTTSETDATSTADINSSWKNEDWSWFLNYRSEDNGDEWVMSRESWIGNWASWMVNG